ncbi:MAG: ferrous iron transport protein A [Thiotrichales bacterium]
MTLKETVPGRNVKVAGFSDTLSKRHQHHLRAYGLEAGGTVNVLQQRPVTIIRIDHTELALDHRIAAQVMVVETA